MPKKLIIAQQANFAALMDRGRALEFFLDNGDFAIGDIYATRVENIIAGINAVFVNMGHSDKMGFLHANDIEGSAPLLKRVFPKQRLLVQVVKEPTGNKGPRVTTKINLIGRFFVLTLEHENIIMSRRISNPDERARLKAIATLLKPPGFGLIIRTEANHATEEELEADFQELLLDRWKGVLDKFENTKRPGMLLRDSKDLHYKVLRDVFHDGVGEIIVDSPELGKKTEHYVNLWTQSSKKPKIEVYDSAKEALEKNELLDELKKSLYPKVELPSGGYLLIQPTEALTAIDINSGKFTSSKTPEETVLYTNLEAATEIARQLRLRNIGGMIVIDFIDMEDKSHRIKVLEHLEKLLDQDPSKPQIGRLSDLGLVEITRHRQERSIYEALGSKCEACDGYGLTFPFFDEILNPKETANPAEENSESEKKDNEGPPEEQEEREERPQRGRNSRGRNNRDRGRKDNRRNKPEDPEEIIINQLLSDLKEERIEEDHKPTQENTERQLVENTTPIEAEPVKPEPSQAKEEIKEETPQTISETEKPEKVEEKKEVEGVSLSEYTDQNIKELDGNDEMPGVFKL